MRRHATVSRVTDDSRLHELLHAASQGNRQAADELLPLVYHELRRMAQAALAHEAKGRTLQPTALVHEAWLRLVENGDSGWDGRRHFVGAATTRLNGRDVVCEQTWMGARATKGAACKACVS